MTRGKRQREEVVTTSKDGSASTIFTDQHLKNIKGFQQGAELGAQYVEVGCGCTSRKYGDMDGILRVYATGQFTIRCQCFPNCENEEGRMTLDQFEKHAGKEGARDWKSSIWVHINDEKVPLKKAKLLQYYKHYSNVANWTSYRKRVYHRDEFVTCSTCKTRRRFHLGTNKELRTYHDAAINQSWTCADWPYDKITCSDDKKKDSRKFCKIYRGCPLSPTCSGCPKCKCSGCVRCRFLDCKCLSCISFMHHAKP